MKKTLRGIKAAVFDLDGTLFDSVSLWHEIDDIFLTKRGITPTDEYRHAIAALGFRATAYYTVEHFGLSDTPERLMEEWNDLARDAYAHTVRIFPGVNEYLAACRAAGIKIAAVTSLCREFAESGLKNNGIAGYFEYIFTSDETGYAKTSPEIYVHAAKTMGVKPCECVAFDDVTAAIRSAKAAGMTTVAVRGKMFDESKADGAADFTADGLFDAPVLE